MNAAWAIPSEAPLCQEAMTSSYRERDTQAMTDTDITLSAAAARRLNVLSGQEGRPVILRVAVDGGGCSGFQYRFDLVDMAEADDLTIERDGAAAVVDVISLALLKGSEIDFVDELSAAEFRVRNPNAKSSCGCGVSFSI
jgi:iron-sulfur cluster assembly accessory protein